MKRFCLKCFLICGVFGISISYAQQELPNILLVISDDLGVDYTNGYHTGGLRPNTPHLDQLMADGITFENVFASPKCTPSRANILAGKYGAKTGVLGTPGNLDTIHESIFRALETQTSGQYADAVIGKWHLSSPANPLHPHAHGADYFMGVMGAGVGDYYAWNRTENGQTILENSYVTSAFTNASIEWVNEQEQPWFLWLAHVAPHGPLHTPPDTMFSIANTNNNNQRYVAMIESVDHELGRLLANISEEERANTLIIYLGDNGTPNGRLQDYPRGHGKNSVYQGGIRVPMIIAGAGVTRIGERESALVHIADIYATLLEIAGADLPGGIYNSLSFAHLLKKNPGPTRTFNYSELSDGGNYSYAIRGSQFKLIDFVTNGTQEFYDLLEDSLEINDLLLGTLTAEQLTIKMDLEAEAAQIRSSWSCRDQIQNGDEAGIDCGGSICSPCVTTGVEDRLEWEEVTLYPNPARDWLRIETKNVMFEEVQILNTLGEVLHAQRANTKQEQISLNDFSNQILFVKVKLDNGWVTKKVLKY